MLQYSPIILTIHHWPTNHRKDFGKNGFVVPDDANMTTFAGVPMLHNGEWILVTSLFDSESNKLNLTIPSDFLCILSLIKKSGMLHSFFNEAGKLFVQTIQKRQEVVRFEPTSIRRPDRPDMCYYGLPLPDNWQESIAMRLEYSATEVRELSAKDEKSLMLPFGRFLSDMEAVSHVQQAEPHPDTILRTRNACIIL